MKKFMLVTATAFALSASASQAAVLYDNGPVVDGSGLSILPSPNVTLGFGAQTSASNVVADNFSVVGGSWNVSSLDFYSYQTGAAGFTFTSATWSIVAGSDVNTGTTVASGTTLATNGGLLGYRVSSNPADTSRAIYRLNTDIPDLILAAGNYFLTWSLAGTGASGPWVPPVVGSSGVGNALQSVSHGPFVAAKDDGNLQPVDLPFSINGTVVTPAVPEPASWAMMIGGLGLVGASMRRRATKVRFA